MSYNKYHEYTECSLGLEYGFGDTCDCAGEAGCAGDEQHIQSSLRKRSGAAVQAFRGFQVPLYRDLFRKNPSSSSQPGSFSCAGQVEQPGAPEDVPSDPALHAVKIPSLFSQDVYHSYVEAAPTGLCAFFCF